MHLLNIKNKVDTKKCVTRLAVDSMLYAKMICIQYFCISIHNFCHFHYFYVNSHLNAELVKTVFTTAMQLQNAHHRTGTE